MGLKLINNYDKKSSDFLFSVRNKKYVRVNSITTNYIKIRDHENWIKKFIKKKNNRIFIISYKKIRVGYIRLESKKLYYWVSWALLKNFKNKKIMSKSLKKVTNKKKIKFKALIKLNNYASIKVALNADFNLKNKKNNSLIFQKN